MICFEGFLSGWKFIFHRINRKLLVWNLLFLHLDCWFVTIFIFLCELLIRIAWRCPKLLSPLLNQLFLSRKFLFDISLVLRVKLLVLSLVFACFFLLLFCQLIYEFVIFEDLFGFGFLKTWLGLWGAGAKVLFSEVFDLLFMISPLFQVLFSLYFKILVCLNFILSLWTVSRKRILLLYLGLFLLHCQLHEKDLIELINNNF